MAGNQFVKIFISCSNSSHFIACTLLARNNCSSNKKLKNLCNPLRWTTATYCLFVIFRSLKSTPKKCANLRQNSVNQYWRICCFGWRFSLGSNWCFGWHISLLGWRTRSHWHLGWCICCIRWSIWELGWCIWYSHHKNYEN